MWHRAKLKEKCEQSTFVGIGIKENARLIEIVIELFQIRGMLTT
jgi:hypothetical protein